MNNELFDLCKEVYEKTGWTGTHQVWHEDTLISPIACGYEDVKNAIHFTPLYTSDYIDEKLKHLDFETYHHANENWHILLGEGDYEKSADTPLKARLKFVIALIDAGVKL